jgi:hypothetical protein
MTIYIARVRGNGRLIVAVSARSDDTIPPEYVSGEIGDIDTSTVEIVFSKDVLAAGDDYSTGVTIKINGVAAVISSGTRQVDNEIVRYVLSAPADINDVITWEYSDTTGLITNTDGEPMLSVSAQTVTNNIGSQLYFDDFNASGHLATTGV